MKGILSCLCLSCSFSLAVELEEVVFKEVEYQVLTVPPADVDLFWKNNNGQIMRQFSQVFKLADRPERQVAFMMNGGIYEPGGVPSGLMVQCGKLMRPLNLSAGKGNFYLKPNGVFLIGADGAKVVNAQAYVKYKDGVRCAVQSGPLLLESGKIHAKFRAESSSRLLRNGVGVNAAGDVVFAITKRHSEQLPNLYEFAEFFKSRGCDHALFLDGDISQLYGRDELAKPNNNFGSIIVVYESNQLEETKAARD